MKDARIWDGSAWQSLRGPAGPSEPSADAGNAITTGSDGLLYLAVESLISEQQDNGLSVGWDGLLHASAPPAVWESVEIMGVGGASVVESRWIATPVMTDLGPSTQRRLVVTLKDAGALVDIALPTATSVSAGQGLFVTASANLMFVSAGAVSAVTFTPKVEYLVEGVAGSAGRMQDVVRVQLDGGNDQDAEWLVAVDITYIEAVT